jgi:hypothetical protein
MSTRDDEIRQLVAELEVHITSAEANLAALRALLAGDDSKAHGEEDRGSALGGPP